MKDKFQYLFEYLFPYVWVAILIVAVVGNIIIFYKKHIIPRKIQNAVRNLGSNLNEVSTKEFTNFIRNLRIPNEPKAWNACRAAYELVRSSNLVSNDAKEDLKRTLLSGGVSGIK